MYRRILVALDGSDAARSAFVFVTAWARQFEAEVWFIHLAKESQTRRCDVRTDVSARGRQRANSFTVSGATRSARNMQLVSTIAEAADTYRADLIVLGFDPERIAHGRMGRSLSEKLTAVTQAAVLVPPLHRAPSHVPTTAKVRSFALRPIALGPTPALPGAGVIPVRPLARV